MTQSTRERAQLCTKCQRKIKQGETIHPGGICFYCHHEKPEPQPAAPVAAGEHTPGPWRDIVSCSTEYEARPYLIYAGAHPVAEINRNDDGADIPNARLISAAPDMLAALQFAFRCWEGGAWKNEDGETPDIEPIRAAISRATGREG